MNAVPGRGRRGYPGAFAALLALALAAGGVWQLARPWFDGAAAGAEGSPFQAGRVAEPLAAPTAAADDAPSSDVCEVLLYVVDPSGKAIAGALAGLVGPLPPVVAETDASGFVLLRSKHVGRATLHVATKDLRPSEERIELVGGARVRKWVVLDDFVWLRVRAESPDSRPLVGARVRFLESDDDLKESFDGAEARQRAVILNDKGVGYLKGYEGLAGHVQLTDPGHPARPGTDFVGRRVPFRFGAEDERLALRTAPGARVVVAHRFVQEFYSESRLVPWKVPFSYGSHTPSRAFVALRASGADPVVEFDHECSFVVPRDATFELELAESAPYRYAGTADSRRTAPLRARPGGLPLTVVVKNAPQTATRR